MSNLNDFIRKLENWFYVSISRFEYALGFGCKPWFVRFQRYQLILSCFEVRHGHTYHWPAPRIYSSQNYSFITKAIASHSSSKKQFSSLNDVYLLCYEVPEKIGITPISLSCMIYQLLIVQEPKEPCSKWTKPCSTK